MAAGLVCNQSIKYNKGARRRLQIHVPLCDCRDLIINLTLLY